jgi:hypothetical protein
MAAAHRQYCAACLLEEALAPVPERRAMARQELTIQMPLGKTPLTTVFLVKGEGSPPRLLRLKIWRRPAGPNFLARFRHLQTALEAWAEEDIDRPLAASLDAAGCPSVLTEFRQGVPILDQVRSGRLDREQGAALLAPLAAVIGTAHQRGLVHGSILGGNVVVDVESGRARLLDFGLRPLMGLADDHMALASADLAGIKALAHTLLTLSDR